LHMLGFIDYYETVQPIAKRRRFSKRLIDQAFVKASEL
jgi:predicted methyltransferase